MYSAGLDFGTTNSLLCLLNDELNSTPEFFHFDTNKREFFPTVVAYDKDGHILIGDAAKKKQGSQQYDYYETFKLKLNEQADRSDGCARSPIQVTEDFLRELFRKLEYERNITVSKIVQTVPDVWQNESDYRNARERLTEIYQKFHMEPGENFFIESEPVAATAYYCQKCGKGNYYGHIIVVDYGGGTLDLTLCRIDPDGTIAPLRRCGSGGAAGGSAGRAFDIALTERIMAKYQCTQSYQKERFTKMCNEFEEAKIACTEQTSNVLEDYYKSDGFEDDMAFAVGDPFLEQPDDFKVLASDIAEVFEAINKKSLVKEIQKMISYCEELKVDIDSQDHMRILMVGGFSNLYCVENTVQELFHSAAGLNDQRFDAAIDRQERSLAIAYGACLIASGIVPVQHVSKYEIGIYAYEAVAGKQIEVPIIERDHPIKDYREACYYAQKFTIFPTTWQSRLQIYFDDGKGRRPVYTEQSLEQLCPHIGKDSNEYAIGFSVDYKNCPFLYIKNSDGVAKSHSLKDLLESISLQIVRETEKNG